MPSAHVFHYAALSAHPTTLGLAVLDAQLTQRDDGWYQLLPVGPFKARDGRPFDVPGGHWQLDKTIATGFDPIDPDTFSRLGL